MNPVPNPCAIIVGPTSDDTISSTRVQPVSVHCVSTSPLRHIRGRETPRKRSILACNSLELLQFQLPSHCQYHHSILSAYSNSTRPRQHKCPRFFPAQNRVSVGTR